MRLLPGPRPLDLGPLFETLAERGVPTVVRLSRPLDVAAERGERWTVPELAELVGELSALLAAVGVRYGDRVAVHKRNHWDYPLLAAATARIGAVPALLSEHLEPAALAALVRRLEPAVLLSDRYTLALGGSRTQVAGRPLRTVSLDGPSPGAIDATTLRGGAVPAVRRRPDDEPLVIVHTSGTTGLPKLVVHSTDSLVRKLTSFEAHRWPLISIRPDDTVGNAGAYAHGRAVSWTISALWARPETVVVLADGEPAEAARLFAAHPPTVLEALPATYVRWQQLAAGPNTPFRDLRLAVSTFDAVHPPTVRTFLAASERRLPIWLQGWGQSETGPITFRFLTRRALVQREQRHPTTRDLGRPVPGRSSLRVVDPATLEPVRRGEPGVVLVRTPNLCGGYLGEEQRWADKQQGSWFNTGDLGVRTWDGRLLLLDREVDQVPGLSCVELEDVLHDRLPELTEAVLLDAGPGRPPLPVLVTADGTLDPARWAGAVHDLPELAEPLLLGWDSLPRTGTGKVRRHELRSRYLAGTVARGTGRWT
ncbi:class I adenylate-forming enzyme family protein [Kitasatospora sp. LaBMicrA B282]|uniref:class I adenylate-forming enzyme family protein n=1 Tax=Kitasatospora sp. LaBMicrA B282 TaxID=3420949 RepID=UPI003D14A0E3